MEKPAGAAPAAAAPAAAGKQMKPAISLPTFRVPRPLALTETPTKTDGKEAGAAGAADAAISAASTASTASTFYAEAAARNNRATATSSGNDGHGSKRPRVDAAGTSTAFATGHARVLQSLQQLLASLDEEYESINEEIKAIDAQSPTTAKKIQEVKEHLTYLRAAKEHIVALRGIEEKTRPLW